MRLINADRLQRVDHIILESTVDSAPTIDAIPRQVIEDIKADISRHCGLLVVKKNRDCNFCYRCHNAIDVSEVLKIIDKHIAEVEK